MRSVSLTNRILAGVVKRAAIVSLHTEDPGSNALQDSTQSVRTSPKDWNITDTATGSIADTTVELRFKKTDEPTEYRYLTVANTDQAIMYRIRLVDPVKSDKRTIPMFPAGDIQIIEPTE